MSKLYSSMKKVILLSIQPKWLQKILNGEKTIEIRKTMPKCELPIDVYLYCTKDRKYNYTMCEYQRSKVVAKFTMREVRGWFYPHELRAKKELQQEILEKSCMTLEELENYAENEHIFYAWHIEDLVIFDKPMELSEFYKRKTTGWIEVKGGLQWVNDDVERLHLALKRAPQSWQYVYVGNTE